MLEKERQIKDCARNRKLETRGVIKITIPKTEPMTRREFVNFKATGVMKDNDDTKTMYCSFCQSFPITADRSNSLTRGTTNLRIEPIKVHESTPEHFSCHRSVSVVCTLLSGDSLAVVIKR